MGHIQGEVFLQGLQLKGGHQLQGEARNQVSLFDSFKYDHLGFNNITTNPYSNILITA